MLFREPWLRLERWLFAIKVQPLVEIRQIQLRHDYVALWVCYTCCYYFRAVARESYDSCNHSLSVTRHSLRHSVDVIQRLTKCFLTLNRTTNRRAAHITWPTITDDRMTDGLSQTFDSKHAQQFYVRTRATSVLQLISSTGCLPAEVSMKAHGLHTRISWISSILFLCIYLPWWNKNYYHYCCLFIYRYLFLDRQWQFQREEKIRH